MSTFSTSARQKAQNTQFFTLLTSKCASRHNGVHFFDTFSTSQLPKVVRDRQFFTLLTWKCASRHNGVHFFDIATSKSGPKLRCFVHFDLEMCFAPQRRALFRHLNFQKWSEAEVFCTFWLGNVLRATTACTFLTSQLPKVVRDRQFLTLLTSKCASRHNGAQFFIAPVASWLRTRRFSEPTFRLSYLFAHLHLLSSYSFSSDLLSSNLPLLSASALLCFSSVHIVGSLTSKLPSIIYIYILYIYILYIYIIYILYIYIYYIYTLYIYILYIYIYYIYILYIYIYYIYTYIIYIHIIYIYILYIYILYIYILYIYIHIIHIHYIYIHSIYIYT